MERLTKECQIGTFASLKDKAISVPGAFGTYDAFWACSIAVNALKAYEDTGLEAKDIPTALEMANVFAAIEKLKQFESIGTAAELRALKEAGDDGRLVVLSVPMLPMVEGDNPNDSDVYCPRCNHDLSGGWADYDPDQEWTMCQCPNCGQSIDDCKVMTRDEAEAALQGERGQDD